MTFRTDINPGHSLEASLDFARFLVRNGQKCFPVQIKLQHLLHGHGRSDQNFLVPFLHQCQRMEGFRPGPKALHKLSLSGELHHTMIRLGADVDISGSVYRDATMGRPDVRSIRHRRESRDGFKGKLTIPGHLNTRHHFPRRRVFMPLVTLGYHSTQQHCRNNRLFHRF